MKIKGMLVFGIAMLLVVSVFTGSMALAQGREETGDTSELNAPADSAWPMFRGSQNHTGRSPYDTSHVDGTEKWSFNTGESMVSSPAIGPDGTIYVGSLDNSLYAFNPDGSKRWNLSLGADIESSPAVDNDGRIYVGTMDGFLVAVNPNGTEAWRYETMGTAIPGSPNIADDGTIYVGDRYGNVDGDLYAINPDGTKKWNAQTGDWNVGAPAVAENGTIYMGCMDGYLYNFNKTDGNIEWGYQTGSSIWESSPAIGPNGTIYVGDIDGDLSAVHPNGTEKWTFSTGNEIHSSPAIGEDGTIYVGSNDGNLYAINPDGTEKWSFSTGNWVFSSPAIGEDGTIYVGSDDMNVYGINPDGTEKWSFSTNDYVDSSPAIGSDGRIYVGSSDNNLYSIGGQMKTLDISSTGGGTVTEPGEGSFTFPAGQTKKLEAEPFPNYHFVRWSGDNGTIADPTDNSTTIRMLDNYTIEAQFASTDHELTINSTSGGNVTVPGEGTFGYSDSDIQNLEAVPDEGHHFVGWSGDNGTIDNTTSNSTTIEMLGNYSITAEFAIDTYELNIESTTGGNVTLPGEGIYYRQYGDVVDLEASPESGYNFAQWTGDTQNIADPTTNSTTIEMLSDHSIMAEFEKETHALNMGSTEGGSVIDPGEGSFTYAHGDFVTLNAEPSEGHHFVRWTGDNGTIDAPSDPSTGITMEDDYTIDAKFAANTYELTINSTEGGSVIEPGEGTFEYDYGTNVTLEAAAQGDYHLVEWTGETGTIVDSTSNSTTIEILDNHNITAEFAVQPQTYTLSISSTSGGFVTEPGEGSFEYESGREVNLEAEVSETADVDYEFVEWTGDNETIGDTKANMTTIEMNDNYTITAEFEEISGVTYELSITSTSRGEVVEPGEGSFTYSENAEVSLDAVPDSGYQFVEWTGDNGTVQDTKSDSTIITMNDNYTITAEFEEVSGVTYELTIDSTSGGTVIEPGEDTFTYSENAEVDLEAVADSGYQFVEWTGDNGTVQDTEANLTTIIMDENRTITATFEESVETNTLTLDIEGDGAVEVNGTEVDVPFEEDYPVDATVELEANASEGWNFTGWTGSVDSDLDSITLVMDEDKNVTAHFEEVTSEQYTLTVNIQGNGTVEVDGQEVDDGWSQQYDDGDSVTLNATADDGYEFDSWTGTDETGQEINIMIDSDMDITANFEETGGDDGGDESTDQGEDDSGWLWWLIPLIIVLVIVIALAVWYTQKGGEDEGEFEEEEEEFSEELFSEGETETGSQEMPESEGFQDTQEPPEPSED